jgi:hypothetical protein
MNAIDTLSPSQPAAAEVADPRRPLTPDMLRRMNAYWRAANFLSVGQIYLRDNAMLDRPLTIADVKPRLLGHWGTTPGLNMLYVHLNRLIVAHDLDMINIIGPGHGGPGLVANTYLEGSYTERYPAIERSRSGMHRLFRQFSWPAASRATSHPRHRGRSTRAANSAIRWRTLMVPRSTTLTCWSRASSGTARRRRGRLQRAGIRTNS